MMELLQQVFDAQLFAAAIRMTAPILLAALGGMLCQHAGSSNISLEGMMLIGCFAAVVGSYYTGSWVVGILAGALAGAAISFFFAVTILKYNANPLVIGVALNIFASGITAFLMRALWGFKGAFMDPKIVPMPKVVIPVIDGIPVLGPIISGHTPMVYIAWITVFVMHFMMFHTPFGLRLRSVGQNIRAAKTVGVKTTMMQYIAMVGCGTLCGMAGAQLSIGLVTMFAMEMTAGRGFVAVVANILGQAVPFGVLGASLLFGFAEGIVMRIQGIGLPSQFVLMLPYITTILAMLLFRERKKKAVLPKQMGQ